jgi:AcrR family transcriptional regulator
MKTHENKKNNVATRENLLDAAERLFAEHGYDGVGMRALAVEAGVNLGAATYHFGSKERLYIETVMRCLLPISEERIKLLRQAEVAAKGKPVPLETIIDCMLRPPLMTALEHPHFSALFARNLFMPPPFIQESLAKNGNQVHEPFIAALIHALPNLPAEVLRVREMFARGVMLMFLSKISVPESTESCDFILKEMVIFIAAGFRSASTIPSFTLPPMPILRFL